MKKSTINKLKKTVKNSTGAKAKGKAKATKTKATKNQTTVNPDASWGVTGTELTVKQEQPAQGESEATREVIVADVQMAQDITPVQSENIAPINIPDELTNSVPTWNSANLVEIPLRENLNPASNNVLCRFDYIPQPLTVTMGEKTIDTGYKILTCSDNGKIVGKPFGNSYGLLNNSDFIGVIESIATVLDKMGLKYKVATTGTLKDRERSFISLQLEQGQEFTIGTRVFQAFLNCLNSIPSNSGCTVTFANNSFCVCCKNSFAHALHCADGTKFDVAIKHTKGMRAALNDIPALIEAYLASNEALFKQLKHFSVFPVGLVDAENYFAAFIGRDAKGKLTDKTEISTRANGMAETLTNLFVKGKGNNGETALDIFSAVTEFYTHYSAGETENKSKQFESSEIGSGANSKREFYSWLVAHTQEKSKFQAVAKVGETLLVAYRAKPKK